MLASPLMTFEYVLAIVTVLYLIQIVFFFKGVSRPLDTVGNAERLFVSVIVAARNEERNLPTCLDSLLRQTYPSDRYEIIVLNDHSSDKTGEICLRYAGMAPHMRIFVPPDDSFLRGKTNALAYGIEQSRGEVILITDADCETPPTWIEETVKRYEPDVGIVGGVTLQRAYTAFDGMQSLDWAYLLGIACAAVSFRNPLSTIGNNLSFRRKAYDEVGGYRKIKFSVTEDYALFQAIVRTGRWRYLYPLDPALLVLSQPCRSVADLAKQKHRWGKGGLDMKPSGFLIMAIGFAEHGLIAASLLTGFFGTGAVALLAKTIGDYFFLHRVLSRLGRTDQLRFFYSFALYYFLYVLILPFMVFFGGRVVWKGRRY